MPAGDRADIVDFISRSWSWIIAFAALLGILAWVSLRIRSRYREDEGVADTEQQFLTEIGEMHREGRLSEAEYRSIKGRLVERLDDATPVTSKRQISPGQPESTRQSGRRDANTEQ